MGNRDIEDSLERLDKLTLEEAWMAAVELLKMTHDVDVKVTGVDDRVKRVVVQVQDVRSDVQDVGDRVQTVEGRVQDVRSDVKSVGDRVQIVEGRVQDIRSDVQDVGDMVQTVEGRVQDVRGDVQDVCSQVQRVDDRVQGIESNVKGLDDKLDQASRSLSFTSLIIIPRTHTTSTGNQLRDSLLRWLSPPSPSSNHNLALKAHHEGTTQWFFQGTIYNHWKSTGSFLWVHGKRALFLTFIMRPPLITSHFFSGVRKKCSLVRPSILSTLVRMTLLFQLLDYTRYYGPARC
jgi:archaellum component FlaC